MKRPLLLLILLALAFGCGSSDSTSAAGPSAGASGGAVLINGAGASFPYPVYGQWAYKYESMTGVKVNYQSIGSGGGIAQIKAKTVDFGASDAPLEVKELDEAGLIQFPMLIGGVVPVVNIAGVKAGQLHLTGEVLAEIYLGTITYWDDDRIKAENTELELPHKAITVVHRSDGSGTTWIYTNYLDKVSKRWHDSIGFGKAVNWPAGIGGKGNEGVSAYVQRVDGAIGYVEYAYALTNKLTHARLKNKANKFVAPTSASFRAAAANAEWDKAPGYYLVLTDQPGEESWPIAGATFILMHKEQANTGTAKAMFKYFDWCYKHGSAMAEELHYVAMPENVVEGIQKAWSAKVSANSEPLWP